MLKHYSILIIALITISIPEAFAAPINSTIGTPDEGFLFSSIQNRTNDIQFSEFNLEKWTDILNIETPNVQPIFYPIIVMIFFGLSFTAANKSKGEYITGMYFLIATIMALVLMLMFSGNMEFGIIEEQTKGTINTSTGVFEVSKTYNTNKIITNDESFRTIFSMVFQLLFYFTILMFIVKTFLQPVLDKRKKDKENQN